MVTTKRARRMRAGRVMNRQVATIAAAIMISGVASTATAYEDYSRAEWDSLNIRHLQSELMVAALSCGLRPQYNAMVKRFEAELIDRGQDLKQLFRRTFGSASQRELDRFVTALANQSSTRSLSRGASYCAESAQLFDEILSLPATSLAVFWQGRADIDRELLPVPIESAAAPRN